MAPLYPSVPRVRPIKSPTPPSPGAPKPPSPPGSGISPSVNGGAGRPPQPPSPAGGGHYTWVNGKGWQLIHATGLNKWAPGPPPSRPPANPVTSTFGLNTSDRTPFNLLGMPRTQGAFNKLVLAAAQPSYQPQLQGIQGQESAEQTAAKERQADIGSIYDQYGRQAQDAFNETKQALTDLATENAGGDKTAQANLAAALASAGSGQGSLAQMMGLSVPQGGTLPYTGAAADAAAASSDQRAGLSAAALAVPGANLANVGNEQATETNTESLRHGAAMQSLENQTSALNQQIPGIIQQARQNLISQLMSGQDINFQEGLANRQFGLTSQAQKFNQNQTQAQFKETQRNDVSNRAAQAAQINQNAQALANQQAATQAAAATALSKAQGQQEANAIKYLTSWITPTKNDMTTKTVRDPVSNTTVRKQILAPGWHKDVGSALRTLMGTYGIDQNTALNMMVDIGASTPVSGQGGQTIAQWAMSFKQRQQQAAANRKVNTPVIRGATKATQGVKLPKLF